MQKITQLFNLIEGYLDWANTQINNGNYESENPVMDYLFDKKTQKLITETDGISLDEFVEQCNIRSNAPNGFNMPDTIPISYWGMAMMGEGGELCNLLAKMERVKAGAVDGGNSLKVADITKEKLAEEIGGIMIYLSILCKRLGISLQDAMVNTFNEKSIKIGYPVLEDCKPIQSFTDKMEQSTEEKRNPFTISQAAADARIKEIMKDDYNELRKKTDWDNMDYPNNINS